MFMLKRRTISCRKGMALLPVPRRGSTGVDGSAEDEEVQPVELHVAVHEHHQQVGQARLAIHAHPPDGQAGGEEVRPLQQRHR